MKDGEASIWIKIRYLYLPFIIITAAFTGVYTFLNWALVIETEWLQIKEDVANIWLPLALCWIPVLIWIRPRIKLLKLNGGNGNIPYLYMLFAGIAMAIPTIITQHYTVKASGELKKFYSIDRISINNPSRYYAFRSHYVDKNAIGVYTSFDVSGQHNEDLNMHIYVAAPLLEKASDTVYNSCLAWLGYKFSERISNRLSDNEKDAKFREFAGKSQADFESRDLDNFIYIERMLSSDDADAYREALKTSPKSIYGPKSKLVFIAVNEPFENRMGRKGMWILISLAVGVIGWLIMVLIPKVDEVVYTRFRKEGLTAIDDGFYKLLVPDGDKLITTILICLNVLVFVAMVFAGLGFVTFKAADLLAWGANFGPAVSDGEWWRLLTSTFLHGGIMHLVANMYALLFVGIFLEPLIGRTKFLAVYLITGVIASCASIWWFEGTVSIGASGAIFGLYGLFLALMLRKVFPPFINKVFLVSILVFIGYNLLLGLGQGIDNAAHIGGLVSGFLIGIALSPGLKKHKLEIIDDEADEEEVADDAVRKATLTREEYIAICRQCIHKELNPDTGLICGLTKKRADFVGSCEAYAEVQVKE